MSACGGSITGCSTSDPASSSVRNSASNCGGSQYEWNGSSNKGRSSTTGNIYGIYDTYGGTWEYVMGNQSDSTSQYVWYSRASGFAAQPDDIYFDKYLASIYKSSTGNYSKQEDYLVMALEKY